MNTDLYLKLTRADTAFIFLDFQQDVCGEGGGMVNSDPAVLERFATTTKNSSSFLNGLRSLKSPPLTIHVMHLFEPGYPELSKVRHSKMEKAMIDSNSFAADQKRSQIVSGMEPGPGEFLLKKHSLSAFATTELLWLLNKNRINTVVFSGVVTQYAVLSATFSAYDHGFSVVVAEDCCMSGGLAMHEAALKIMGSISTLADSQTILASLK